MSNLMLKKLDSIIKPCLNANFMAKKALSENTKILTCVETIQKSAFEKNAKDRVLDCLNSHMTLCIFHSPVSL